MQQQTVTMDSTSQHHHYLIQQHIAEQQQQLMQQQQESMSSGPGVGFEIDLLDRAAEIVQDKTKNSTVFDSSVEDTIPRFRSDELTFGRVLGVGGFCTVREITKVTLNKDANVSGDNGSIGNGSFVLPPRGSGADDDDEGGGGPSDAIQDRQFISERYLRKGKDARYAIKKLSDDIMEEPERFISGVIDLAIEARFLAVIKHPNIIKMRAMADSDPYSRGYFLILDRLYDTLTKRFTTWKRARSRLSGITMLCDVKGTKKKNLFIDRLLVAYDLASALRYLHSLNIVYRDLKPDNIGFDVRGDVKIFDFGLARELTPEEKQANDLYTLSGHTGSLRYMAPEVALSEPYNETVDVYSFGILLWQICTLEVPYATFTVAMHSDLVVKTGIRPTIDITWASTFQNLLRNCWSANPENRPGFEEIGLVIRDYVSVLRGDEAPCVLDMSNRTAKSIQEQR